MPFVQVFGRGVRGETFLLKKGLPREEAREDIEDEDE